MTSTVVERASINEAGTVNAEHLHVAMNVGKVFQVPELDWYPRAYFRAQYIPDSLLDEWVASGDVRAKKATESKQSTRFYRLADVREKLANLVDVKAAKDNSEET